VVLEISERQLLQRLDSNLELMNQLRDLGFKLSVDDFGSGYTHLDKLSQLPFTELKLDRMVLSAIPHNQMARSMVEASVQFAHEHQLNVVFEGVETQYDWDVAVELGSNVAQGYFLTKPVDAEQFLIWWRDWDKMIAD
jgi:EAL domain-containing protein (putative c-di-GMP-specific phosphodiesterase class I)